MSAVKQTQAWINEFVVGHGLCPFAAKPIMAQLVRFTDCPATTTEETVQHFLAELLHLSEQVPAQLETTLICYPSAWAVFEDFLAFIDLCQELLEESGAVDDFQLAHFHPDYCFADTEPEDVSNRTNRSPYPTLQLLRADSVEAGLAGFGDAEDIWQRNIEKMKVLFG